MNARTNIQPVVYSLSNAFAASGYISGTLMRLQWSDRFAAMEDELADAWGREVSRRRYKPENLQLLNQAAKDRRDQQVVMVLEALAGHRMSRDQIAEASGIGGSTIKEGLRKMKNAGQLSAKATGPNGSWIYEVAQ